MGDARYFIMGDMGFVFNNNNLGNKTIRIQYFEYMLMSLFQNNQINWIEGYQLRAGKYDIFLSRQLEAWLKTSGMITSLVLITIEYPKLYNYYMDIRLVESNDT